VIAEGRCNSSAKYPSSRTLVYAGLKMFSRDTASVRFSYLPGLNAVAAPLAGGAGANFARFLLFDSLGTLIWVGIYVFTGYAFSDQLEIAIGYAMRMGTGVFAIALFTFAAWIAWKVLQRRRFINSIKTGYSPRKFTHEVSNEFGRRLSLK